MSADVLICLSRAPVCLSALLLSVYPEAVGVPRPFLLPGNRNCLLHDRDENSEGLVPHAGGYQDHASVRAALAGPLRALPSSDFGVRATLRAHAAPPSWCFYQICLC